MIRLFALLLVALALSGCATVRTVGPPVEETPAEADSWGDYVPIWRRFPWWEYRVIDGEPWPVVY